MVKAAKILVVEDDKLLSESYRIILEAQFYEVDVASSGLEALDFCGRQGYDLILLDMMMPELDGLGFLKRFSARTQPDRPTRIIISSNLTSGDEINEALRLGAHAYIQIYKSHNSILPSYSTNCALSWQQRPETLLPETLQGQVINFRSYRVP